MKTLVLFTTRNKPLMIFFALTFGIAWLLMGAVVLEARGKLDLPVPMIPLLLLGSWLPNLAAFFVIRQTMKDKNGVRNLIRGWCKWRVDLKWYLVSFSPLLLLLIALGLHGLIQGSFPLSSEVVRLEFLFPLILMALITGATGEELGWRGFALPWLQTILSPLWSSVVLGLSWSVWHLPLWFGNLGFETTPFLIFTLIGVSFSVVATWACNNTKGSTFIASLFHLFLNVAIAYTDEVSLYFALAFVALALYAGWRLHRDRTQLPLDKDTKAWVA